MGALGVGAVSHEWGSPVGAVGGASPCNITEGSNGFIVGAEGSVFGENTGGGVREGAQKSCAVISQKVFMQSFCGSQPPHKPVNSSFTRLLA